MEVPSAFSRGLEEILLVLQKTFCRGLKNVTKNVTKNITKCYKILQKNLVEA